MKLERERVETRETRKKQQREEKEEAVRRSKWDEMLKRSHFEGKGKTALNYNYLIFCCINTEGRLAFPLLSFPSTYRPRVLGRLNKTTILLFNA